MNNPMPSFRRRFRRGSVLGVTLIFAVALAATAAAYMNTVTVAYKTTQANQTYHSLLPVGERGVDEAMHTLYRYFHANAPSGVWPTTLATGMWTNGGWKAVGTRTYAKDFGTQSVTIWGAQRYARLKVIVRNIPDATVPDALPNVVAEVGFLGGDSTAWGADKSAASSYVRQFGVWLKSRSNYANAMVGVKSVTVKGGVFSADSYKSSAGYTGVYSSANPGDKATIATLSALDDAISTGSISVRGYVVTGGDNPVDGISGSHVYAYSTDPSYAYASKGIDPSRVAWDFSATLKPATAPSSTGALAFPAPVTSGSGSSKTTTYTLTSGVWRLGSDLKLSGDETIVVSGNATLIVDPGVSVSMSGRSSIQLSGSSSTLKVYTPGDFSITGNGILNGTDTSPGRPTNVQLFGTNTTAGGQTITLTGNAAFSGMVYAPNAGVEIKGGGSSGAFFGSVVGYTILANGGTTFHYDETLSTVVEPSFMLSSWLELTGASRVKMSDFGL